LLKRVGDEGAWGAWVRRWTAEEARHATSLRDYLLLSRNADPVALERDRMQTLQVGWSARGKGLLRALVYASLQELATRIAHRNTGMASGDPVAERLLTRIAADEALHMLFYRELVSAALDRAPEQTVVAIADEIEDFAMPGAETPGFLRRSVLIAHAGIYDVRIHRDEVVAPLLRHWQALARSVSGIAAGQAQLRLTRKLEHLGQMAIRYEERAAARHAGHRRAPESDDPRSWADELP
jgi:acyl-[acyl-carrier-protein] desaturase